VSSGIYIAAAGAVAQSTALDATANNISNATTAGFRGDRVTFREAFTSARSSAPGRPGSTRRPAR
jgi:flagellar basal body rod protein FlgG